MQLRRVTIGVDGFNNTDLHFLQKGYNMDTVLNIAKHLSSSHIPTLMYCILTTFETDCSSLFESLLNMLRLTMLDNIYIGPTITPCIYVHDGNKKLYPRFNNENFIYLQVESIKQNNTCNEYSDFDKTMSAQILPKDRFVRHYLNELNFPTAMESAYIIPIMCLFMKHIAQEINCLYKIIYNDGYKEKLTETFKKLRQRYERKLHVESEKKLNSVDINMQISNINDKNTLSRSISDFDSVLKLLSNQSSMDQYYSKLIQMVENYSNFSLESFDCQVNEKLSSSVRRLITLPIKVFDYYIKYSITKSDSYLIALKKDFSITTEECKVFQRLIKIL